MKRVVLAYQQDRTQDLDRPPRDQWSQFPILSHESGSRPLPLHLGQVSSLLPLHFVHVTCPLPAMKPSG
jgi:hypothetical protein